MNTASAIHNCMCVVSVLGQGAGRYKVHIIDLNTQWVRARSLQTLLSH